MMDYGKLKGLELASKTISDYFMELGKEFDSTKDTKKQREVLIKREALIHVNSMILDELDKEKSRQWRNY